MCYIIVDIIEAREGKKMEKQKVILYLLGSMILVLCACPMGMGQEDDSLFIHHSCGENWLNDGLREALQGKTYIDEVNEIYYGDVVANEAGRPASLGEVPGDNTNMNHWILWFNDYLSSIESQGCADGRNHIVMFKSCFPTSNVTGDGTWPGNPFVGDQTITNYQSVYRHAAGSAETYAHNGAVYQPLEQVFAAHPDILFIPVTAPPLHYGPWDDSNNENARRAREFNNWLVDEWLPSYQSAHPDLDNVAVFDWFDILAFPDAHTEHPNRLRMEFGGNEGDSHPNQAANEHSVNVFSPFIDTAHALWTDGEAPEPEALPQPENLTIFHRDGQSFLTWAERDDLIGEQYVVYRHTEAITAANLSSAEVLATLPEESCAYWTERMRAPDYPPDSNGGYTSLRNYVIQPLGEELADGTGFFVWTAQENQSSYYAVTTLSGGEENQEDFTPENTFGPLRERIANPSPVLVWESENGRGRVYTQFMDYAQWNPTYETHQGLTYAYNYFVGLPSQEQCGGTVEEPMALLLHIEGYGSRYQAGDGSHYFCAVELWCDDPRQSWYYGYSATHDYANREAPVTTGPIINFTEQRVLRAVYDILRDEEYTLDPQRVYAYGHSMGGSGALALGMRYPNVFAAIYASEPMTDYGNSGFWVAEDLEPKWGAGEHNLPIENRGIYASHLSQYNGMGVWDWQNHQNQLVERRGDEMAFISLAHGTEDNVIIWESQGNLVYEPLNHSRHAFSAQTVTADHTWIGFNGMGPNLLNGSGMFGGPFADFQMGKNETVPALSHASGSGALPPNGVASYNMNIEWSAGWLPWDGPPIDTEEAWGISLRTTDGSTQQVNVTPRRPQHFQFTPGLVCNWENRNMADNTLLAAGTAVADSDGLLTIEDVQVNGNGTRLLVSSSEIADLPTSTPTPPAAPTSTPTAIQPLPTATPSDPADLHIPLVIDWPENYSGVLPITVGVPFPPGSSIPETLTVADTEGPIPCQSSIPITPQVDNHAYVWVYFDFIAQPDTVYHIESGEPPAPSTPITVTERLGGGYQVNTGEAVFEIAPDSRILGAIVNPSGTTLVSTASWLNGETNLADTPATIQLEQAGPLQAALTLRAEEAVHGLDLIARLHFYAGQPFARVRLTLVNHNEAVVGADAPDASNGECGVQPNQPIIQGLDCPNTI
ncbi:hypothetical protein GF373_10290, partial [bacterium]|nr:hypothetical protein [bacterium]